MAILDLGKPYKESSDNEGLVGFLQLDSTQQQLSNLEIDWATRSINQDSSIIPMLEKFDFVSEESGVRRLTKQGILILGRIAIDMEEIFSPNRILHEKYKIIEPINTGKNSATFLIANTIFNRKYALKVIRPGAAENITESLTVISGEKAPENLVQPVDYLTAPGKDIFGNTVVFHCIVFPYILGETLRSFLSNTKRPINAFFVNSYVKQIGTVLAYLESLDAYHGDLHEENIIVSRDQNGFLIFSVIDVSFGVIGSLTADKCQDNDFKYFIQHLRKILTAQQSYLEKMSIRKYLGARVYSLASKILSSEKIKFSEIIELYESEHEYLLYSKAKESFIREKFNSPGGFKLLRYEEITTPEVAVQLFEPFPELFASIQEFGNTLISGHRGSGKSTYLASLAFFPTVELPVISFKETFGIYFPCRQGEFKIFSSEMFDNGKMAIGLQLHILILKIVRRTLEIICEAITHSKIDIPQRLEALEDSLSIFMPEGAHYSSDGTENTKIKNLVSNISRIEMKEIDQLYRLEVDTDKRLANEMGLIAFFKALKKVFESLSNTRFYILFDDAGVPNVPIAAQKLINELLQSSNPDYCVKFTAEKYSYNFQSISGKNLEPGHDYVDHDISRTLLIGGGNQGINQVKLEEYFRKIVERRLGHLNYGSTSIVKYLGDMQISLDTLADDLSKMRRSAYYCGWTTVWKIADRTPRNLLEIVSEIFSIGNIDESSIPHVIKNRDQDKAIRLISEKRLRALSQISGQISIFGQNYSLGRKLYEIANTIGTVFRLYLQSSRGVPRKSEFLAIERNDFTLLSPDAEEVLKKLITFGVLDESKIEIARDDNVKKPIYVLNRIYCPFFNITYRRDQHLRVSKGKFEELLLNPMLFLQDGTSRLQRHTTQNSNTGDLFEDM